MKKLILSALVLALTGGAASADRHGGRGGHAQGGVVVHDSNRGGSWQGNGGGRVVHENRGWNNGGRDHDNGWGRNGGGRVVVHGNGGWRGEPRYYHNRGSIRANIWMPRPVIRTHYYHYGYRPTLVSEDYGYREGYIFVRGDWAWNGYEWMWQPGHYEPDPAFVEVY
jgi:hypothetical protein